MPQLTGMMSGKSNKVKFGLKNCHYAKTVLDQETNEVTFGTPVAIPGAVNLSLDPEGDTEPFYADDMVYYTTIANNGYSGDLELALIPDHFRKEILKETEDANGVLIEDSTVETENATNVVSATGQSGVAVTILVNGVAHTSGQSATWEDGTNTVTVIASKTGCTSTAYTVTVTKNSQG